MFVRAANQFSRFFKEKKTTCLRKKMEGLQVNHQCLRQKMEGLQVNKRIEDKIHIFAPPCNILYLYAKIVLSQMLKK